MRLGRFFVILPLNITNTWNRAFCVPANPITR